MVFHLSKEATKGPESFVATAVVGIFPQEEGERAAWDPEIQIEDAEVDLLSMGVLKPVWSVGNFEERWDLPQEEGCKRLRGMLQVERIGEGSSFRLRCTGNYEPDIESIMNSWIECYEKVIKIRNERYLIRQLEELDTMMTKQEDLSARRNKDLTVLVQQFGIPVLDEEMPELGVEEKEALAILTQEIIEAQSELSGLKTQIGEYKKGNYAINLAYSEYATGRLRELSQKLESAKVVSENTNADLIEKEAARQSMELTVALMEKEAELVMLSLEKRAEILTKRVELLKVRRGELQDRLINMTLQKREFENAHRSYRDSQNVLQELRGRLTRLRHSLSEPQEILIVREGVTISREGLLKRFVKEEMLAWLLGVIALMVFLVYLCELLFPAKVAWIDSE